jgi:dUTPase
MAGADLVVTEDIVIKNGAIVTVLPGISAQIEVNPAVNADRYESYRVIGAKTMLVKTTGSWKKLSYLD